MNLETVIKKNYIDKENIFAYDNYDIIVIPDKNNNPWFRASDFCKILKYKDTNQAIRYNIVNKNKKPFNDLKKYVKKIPKNVQPHSIFINKNGLIQLLMASRKLGLDKLCE